MSIKAIIPAAGKGTRLGTQAGDLPKVMRLCGGKPLLETVLGSTDFIAPEDTYIVVGYKKEDVMSYFGDTYHYVEQTQQLGTGHAVWVCHEAFENFDGTVLVTFGDMPLFREEDMKAMCETLEKENADCVIMTAENPELALWARIIRDEKGGFKAIVEGKDCTPEQAQIKELFAGVLCFKSRSLFDMLPKVSTNNVQGEYYLTEVPDLMLQNNMKIITYMIADGNDLRGVNTREDLARCEEELLRRRNG